MCRKFCAITSSFAARPGNVETPVWPDLRPTTFTLASFKKFYQLFFQITLRNILLRFSFPHSFIQRQIPLFLDTLQWPLSNSCHPSPVKYAPISFGKAFPDSTQQSVENHFLPNLAQSTGTNYDHAKGETQPSFLCFDNGYFTINLICPIKE